MDILKQSYTFGASPLTSEPDKKPLRAYLMGAHISGSRSPEVLSTMFEAAHLSWKFDLYTTTDPADFSKTLQDDSTIGISITMPNKLTFMPQLDDMTEQARAIGAVNTAFVRLDRQGRRRYIGANTDCIGIWGTLEAVPSISKRARGQPALVIGSGGAARSAVYALWAYFQPSEIYIVNRLKSEVDDIIRGMERTVSGIKLRHVDSVDAAHKLPAPVISIGTVPDYPPKTDEEITAWKVCESLLKRAGDRGVLLDMCYMPNPWTRLCQLGHELGCTVLSGSEILARVCAAQYVLWAERDVEPAALEKMLRLMRSVAAPKAKL